MRCPGEGKCLRLTRAAGSTPEEKAHACMTCPDCEGRAPLAEDEAAESQEDEIVDRVERIVRERDGGRPVCLSELSPVEWELVLVWDQSEREYEQAHQRRVEQMFGMLVSLAAPRTPTQ